MGKKSKLNLINDDLTWNADRRYKVNSVVQLNGENYQNITGKNSNPELLIDWQKSENTPTTEFVKKSERANVVLTGSGVINQLDLVDEKATIVFKGSVTRLNTISYASVPYNGKRITLFNAQATPVTIGHSVSGYGVDFVFANGQDYILKPNETIEFSYDITFAPYAHHMLIGSKGITNWSELQDKPSTFPPSAHTHVISDVVGLQGNLNGKQNSITGDQNYLTKFGSTGVVQSQIYDYDSFVTIGSNENLGSKLNVKGTLRSLLESSDTGDTILNGIEGVSSGFQITKSAGNVLDYKFSTGSNIVALNILNSGNVLINKTDDNGSKLQVNGTISADPAITSSEVVILGQLNSVNNENVKLLGDQSIDGTKAFLQPIKISSGSLAAPSISFFNETSGDTGFNHNSDGVIDVISNGNLIQKFEVDKTTSLVPIIAKNNFQVSKVGGAGKIEIDGDQSMHRKYSLQNVVTGISNAGFEIRDETGGFTPMYINDDGKVTFNFASFAPTATAGTNTTQIATTAFVTGADSGNVKLTGAQTVSGVKTFSSSPIVPTAVNTNEAVNKGQLDAAVRPYKVYTALLSQSGTNSPIATVLENTLGGTIIWTRNSAGSYTGTLSNAFTANKTVVFISPSTNIGGYQLYATASLSSCNILSTNAGGTLVEFNAVNTSIEIRVYP